MKLTQIKVITRSTSHHNLLARSLVHGPLARAAPSAWLEPTARVARPSIMDDLLLTGSDYDSDLNLADWQPTAIGRRSKSTTKLMMASASRNSRGLPIDSRAAEFNQFLQGSSRAAKFAASGQQDSTQTSDEDNNINGQHQQSYYATDFDYDAYGQEPGDAYGQATPVGTMKRSKSCVFGANNPSSSKADRAAAKTSQQAGQQVQAGQQAAKYGQGAQK